MFSSFTASAKRTRLTPDSVESIMVIKDSRGQLAETTSEVVKGAEVFGKIQLDVQPAENDYLSGNLNSTEVLISDWDE